jgi:hypothetical protein
MPSDRILIEYGVSCVGAWADERCEVEKSFAKALVI